MVHLRYPGLWSVPTVLLVAIVANAQQYSRLNPGSNCQDYHIQDVSSESECFGTAAKDVGLETVTTLRLDGLGFTGCVYNIDANILMYGVSSTTGLTLSSWQYVCNGTASSTTTTTVTVTTATTTTITIIMEGYSLIDFLEKCSDYQIVDVPSSTACFDEAVVYLGLTGAATLAMDGLGFTGCVYFPGSNRVFFGNTTGVVGATSAYYKYICLGIATTTTTTTTTTTVTITTTTTSTITVTTTTTTTTTSTVTTSTSTLTTTTSTTSTKTTSTSTATTTTYTGSSSTTTSATETTSTYTTVTNTTTTSTTFTTETTSTSTMTTSTFTTRTTTWTDPPPGAAFVGDDPLTLYGDRTRRFWLPEGELVPLFRTPELQLLGSATNYGTEQWIDRLVLTSPVGESVIQISIRNDISTFDLDKASPDAFGTLNISLDWLGGLALKDMPPPEAYAYQWGSVVFAFSRVPNFKIGKAQSEMLVAEGNSVRLVVMSMEALASDAEDTDLAATNAHLDFVLQMKARDTCEGVLPEIWGIKPVSNDTLAMLESPY